MRYETAFTVKILPGLPPSGAGKLAEAELHFTDGVLAGVKLIGFAVYTRPNKPGEFNVTVPARQYSIDGERRSFAILRPWTSDAAGVDLIRAAIVAAYKAEVKAEVSR